MSWKIFAFLDKIFDHNNRIPRDIIPINMAPMLILPLINALKEFNNPEIKLSHST